MTSWIKAGLIGGAALSLLALSRYVLPTGAVVLVLCCVNIVAYLVVCAGTGALSAHWLAGPRNAGTAAGQGAMAGGLAGLIGGAVGAIAMLIQSATIDPATVALDLSPDVLSTLKEWGITIEMIESSSPIVGGLLGGCCCCAAGIIVASALGAAGGAIWAAIRPSD